MNARRLSANISAAIMDGLPLTIESLFPFETHNAPFILRKWRFTMPRSATSAAEHGTFLLRGSSMANAQLFRDAIRKVRAGDQQAAAELVRHYEPLIRREVRMHLEDSRLRRAFDSMDIVQSVLASFFLRAAAGEYDLDKPEQLARLLTRIARNKLASAARRHYRLRRDARARRQRR